MSEIWGIPEYIWGMPNEYAIYTQVPTIVRQRGMNTLPRRATPLKSSQYTNSKKHNNTLRSSYNSGIKKRREHVQEQEEQKPRQQRKEKEDEDSPTQVRNANYKVLYDWLRGTVKLLY